MTADQIQKGKAILQRMTQQYLEGQANLIPPEIRDTFYEQALEFLESEDLPTGLSGTLIETGEQSE